MYKRKREKETFGTSEEKTKAALKAQIANGEKLVSRALKLARGQEQQKLVKRLRKAREQADDKLLARVQEEQRESKVLDLHATAKRHVLKTFSKTKPVSALPCSEELLQIPAFEINPIQANLVSRLLNSNPVQEATKKSLIVLGRELELDLGDAVRSKKKVKTDPKTTKAKSNADSAKATVAGDNVSKPAAKAGSHVAEDNGDDAQSDGSIIASIEGTDDDVDEATLSRVAPPSSAGSRSSSPSQSSDNGLAPKSSAFLPSLSMHGYISGSSSPEPLEDERPKKNRMGQRARQAKWEEKYGQQARHLQKDNAGGGRGGKRTGRDERNSGWDARKGAVGDDDRERGRKWRDGRDGARGGFGGSAGRGGRGGFGGMGGREPRFEDRPGMAPEKPKGKEKEEGKGVLHPSWVAARKAKLVEKKAEFAGKKITFD